jgi:DNA-directed RNA polymerase subunit beta'
MAEQGNDFNMVRIALASPEQINTWSYGEVMKPETINYRTLRPERDGLFCERIFGPTKDWECYCGKYKKIRYKGVICDRCGVEVARAKVRRERMGHIKLAAPVAHIWFSKGTPSRLGLLLDLSPRNLERVLYFAQYLIVKVDDELRLSHIERLQSELESLISALTQDTSDPDEEASTDADPDEEASTDADDVSVEEVITLDGQDESMLEQESIQSMGADDISKRRDEVLAQIETLEELSVGQLITETRYRGIREHYADVFKARMGAEAILEVLKDLDLVSKRLKLQEEIRSTSGQKRKKAIKTLRVFEAFRKSGNKPEWMVFSVLPVLPPELRPMVQLDGGRFATSDLNDLYRRVINRNNRLKRLLELRAPEIIIRNEKRMLQESVDALIDNGRRGRAVSGSHNHKLKSLSDLLRGKQGRFRQNLLGKRVDYSGRSVITVGPTLKLYECGLPRRMALELFKPFVMNRLVARGYAHNIKSAKRLAESDRPEVWDILEEIVAERPVLLNRAPTLHRLGIQAFKPVLVEGGTIKVHPLVCTAFNADFDGDQMAVHVPLSKEAVREANTIMLSSNNMLSPSSGDPTVVPTLDIVLGCYYMTMVKEDALGSGRSFPSFEDACLAYELDQIDLRALIKVRKDPSKNDILETSVGRLIFNDVLPDEIGFRNQEFDKAALKELTTECYHVIGNEKTVEVLDAIKSLGFKYASKAGITIAINDVEVSKDKDVLVAEADRKVDLLEQQYMDGLITEDERYSNVVQIWTAANDSLTKVIEENLHNYGGIYLMAKSGAKGNIAQIKQMAGMRGLMSDPKGRIIDRPIKSNFREGLSVLEYFISTHGARKGLADTALRTADSGYLTRRLIDVSQEITITVKDCETEEGIWAEKTPDMPLVTSFSERITSRYSAAIIADPETGEVIIGSGEIIDENVAQRILQANVSKVLIRSPLTCNALRGVCSACYGISLATWRPAVLGEAVGIIAAQSIGEPGTQLTMRTFHTGGIAGADITSGLPRVEELFEARSPKGEAVLSEIDGIVEISEMPEGRTITVISSDDYSDEYSLSKGHKFLVKDGDMVNIGTKIAGIKSTSRKKKSETEDDASSSVARVSGLVKLKNDKVSISWADEERREYIVPAAAHIMVNDGDSVVAGQAMTAGPKSPQQVLRIQGRVAVQKYLIEEVQKVYQSQGVTIHDRHIEIVVTQMLRKVRIDSPGDSDLLPGELVDRFGYDELNAGILAEGGEPSTATQVLLGVTRASLNVESFLAAASFQETTRVLTESSINGDIDYLRGLKENVIIGRLIPARIDSTEEGRKMLGISEDEEDKDQKFLSEPVENRSQLESDGFKEPIAPFYS